MAWPDDMEVGAGENRASWMRPDIDDLQRFYASRQGQLARRLIHHQLKALWPDLAGRTVLGFGYAAPFLAGLDSAERAVALMPAQQGACRWPADGEVPDGAGARGRAAAGRRLGRSGTPGPCARMLQQRAAPDARGLARARRWRPDGGGGAEPARPVVPERPHAVRARPALQPRPARADAERPSVRDLRRAHGPVPAADPVAAAAAAGGPGRAAGPWASRGSSRASCWSRRKSRSMSAPRSRASRARAGGATRRSMEGVAAAREQATADAPASSRPTGRGRAQLHPAARAGAPGRESVPIP